MARGRMLNRKVSTSQKVADLERVAGPYALVFHHRLIAFLDKNGNCRADPYWLKAEVMPRVSGVDPEDCRKYVAALVKVGLAVLYEIDGMPYLHTPGFRGEQVGLRADRESAEVPIPQGFDEDSGTLPESFRQPSGYYPEEARGPAREAVRGREGEVEVEGEGTTTKSPSLRSVDFGADAPSDEQTEEEVDPKAIRAEVIPLIRKHLWLGKDPPPGVLEKEPKWGMGREADIAIQWLKAGDVADLDEACGLIRYARHALDIDGPLSLLFLNSKEYRDRFQEALQYARREVARQAARETEGDGPTRIGEGIQGVAGGR